MPPKKELKFPVRPFKSRGGARVEHRKNTAELQSVVMPAPAKVILPLQQHIGAPCVPTVQPGDSVTVGQVIGDSEKYIGAPIHASVSGTVTKITKVTMPSGQTVDAVEIASDGQMTIDPSLEPPKVDTLGAFIKAVRASGLVGLGGAGFPAHVKLNVPKDKPIDTLLVNVAECEPYITADHREAIENSWDVLSGIYTIKELLGIKRVLIAVEENKPDVIDIFTRIADNEQLDPNDEVRVLKLKSRYPQGAEKVLIQSCTGRKVPAGGLPSDVGCLVMNVTSVAFLAKYIKTGMPLVTKRITVDGSAIQEPKNVIVPIGTPIHDVIEFCGGYKTEPKKLLMGGPMMGLALTDDSLPILKQNNAILAFDESEAKLMEPTACIRCGRCVFNCPMNLMPTLLEKHAMAHNGEELKRMGVMTCMECGTCVYNCPAGRPLVQAIRLGKTIVKGMGV